MRYLIAFIVCIGVLACNSGEQATTTAETPKQVAKQPTQQQQQRPVVNNPAQRKVVNQPQAKRQQPPPRDPNKPYSAKNEGWLVNLDQAYELSQKSGKPIMANFTGSDWCGWCKRLDKSVFHQPGFEKWADENVVLLEVDFPRRFRLPQDVAAQNMNLQKSFGVRGYPTIWVFDASKDDSGKYSFEALGKTGYTKTLEEFQKTVGGYISKRG